MNTVNEFVKYLNTCGQCNLIESDIDKIKQFYKVTLNCIDYANNGELTIRKLTNYCNIFGMQLIFDYRRNTFVDALTYLRCVFPMCTARPLIKGLDDILLNSQMDLFQQVLDANRELDWKDFDCSDKQLDKISKCKKESNSDKAWLPTIILKENEGLCVYWWVTCFVMISRELALLKDDTKIYPFTYPIVNHSILLNKDFKYSHIDCPSFDEICDNKVLQEASEEQIKIGDFTLIRPVSSDFKVNDLTEFKEEYNELIRSHMTK